MRPITLQPSAEAEASAAAAWYEAEQPGLGIQFLLELDAAIERVADNPLAYECVFMDARRVLVRRFPYAIYFTCGDDAIRIFAVLHQHRAPAAWQCRPGR